MPIKANISDKDSPLRVIKEIAQPEDFVSFKLDIDCPEVEIPIVLQLLNDTTLIELVDEFFFELHFRCEVMMRCGWGTDSIAIPYEMLGLQLDRSHALELFSGLRQKGIRAHIWP